MVDISFGKGYNNLIIYSFPQPEEEERRAVDAGIGAENRRKLRINRKFETQDPEKERPNEERQV